MTGERKQRLATGFTTRARLLALAGLVATLVGAGSGRPALFVLAAVILAPLLLGAADRLPDMVAVRAATPDGILIEDQTIPVTSAVDAMGTPALMVAEIAPGQDVAVSPSARAAATRHRSDLSWTFEARLSRWGRAASPSIAVTAYDPGGLRVGRLRCSLPIDLVAVPRPALVSPRTTQLAGRARVGNHAQSRAGSGVEFFGVRPFLPGDALRDVHWPTSERKGDWFVTERAAETAVDVVIVVDVFAESGPRGASTLDASLRGTAGLARALLNAADRVGLVLLGDLYGPIPPASSNRQWHRLVARLLDAETRHSYVTPDLARLPRRALPPGAVIIVFTPLLDERVLSVIADLRRRMYDVVVVDVLSAPPGPLDSGEVAALGFRLWREQRAATIAQLERIGCRCSGWDGHGALDLPLAAAGRTRQRRRASYVGARS